MRILVTGSRNYDDAEPIRQELAPFPPGTVLIHGAARGADSLAEQIGAELGFEVIACPADCKKHGKAAGPIRHQQMLTEHAPDLVIAFPLGESRGTYDMAGGREQRELKRAMLNLGRVRKAVPDVSAATADGWPD